MNRRFSIFLKFLTRQNKLRTFLLFFLIAALFWILMQLGKTYVYTFKVPVSYQNLPPEYYKGFLPNDTVSVKLRLSGFKILRYKMLKPTLNIDVQKSGMLDKHLWHTTNHLSKIEALFDENTHIISVSPKRLSLKIKAVHKKQVPVYPDVSITFKAGFKNKQKAVWQPDSLWLFGQPAVLDTIVQVRTKTYRFDKINHDIDKKLIVKPIKGVKFNTESIRYRLPVSEIIEDTLNLPVTILDKPAHSRVLLFPKKIKLKFKVFKENYKRIKPEDFQVAISFRSNSKYWVPKLIKHPASTFDFSFTPDKISYLIKQQ